MKITGLVLSVMLLLVSSASATLVIDGDIATPSEVDWLCFSVASTQLVTIDILAREEIGPPTDAGNPTIDLNGDGEITLLDTFIYLFPKQPGLTPADVIAYNDDEPILGTADGSTSPTDSFLQLLLGPGDYLLALGAYDLSAADALAGFNPYGIRTGDYRVTITGAESCQCEDPIVPEPSSLALLGLGLGGVAAFRRRRKA